MTLEDRVFRTLSEANDKICRWINGSAPHTDEFFRQLAAVAHPALSTITPSGNHQERGAIWADLREAYGSNPNFRVATPREHTRLLFEDTVLVVAEAIELQDGAAAVDRPRHARRITLICFKDEIATHGLIIRHMHESYVTAEDEKLLDWSLLDTP